MNENKSKSENVEENVKYMKTWTGVITGSFAGREDGYPTTKETMYNSLEELARDYGTKPDEKYYKITELGQELYDELDRLCEEDEELSKLRKKRKLQFEIEQKQKELDELI